MGRAKKRELQRFQQYFTCLSDRRRSQPAETTTPTTDDQGSAKAS